MDAFALLCGGLHFKGQEAEAAVFNPRSGKCPLALRLTRLPPYPALGRETEAPADGGGCRENGSCLRLPVAPPVAPPVFRRSCRRCSGGGQTGSRSTFRLGG
jgi:hypothetical protein